MITIMKVRPEDVCAYESMLANYQRLLDMGYNAEQVEDVASAYAENKVFKKSINLSIICLILPVNADCTFVCRMFSSRMMRQRWRTGVRRPIFWLG